MFVNLNREHKFWLIRRTRALFLGVERPVLEVEVSSPILSSTGNFEYIKCVFTFFTYEIHSWNSDIATGCTIE
jgi:hypothetical protein